MQKIKKQIDYTFGEKVACRITDGGAKIQYNIGAKNGSVNIAIMLHSSLSLAIIWNVHYRRESGSTAHFLSLSESWETILPDRQDISVFYKKFRTDQGKCYEKILVMSIDVLQRELNHLRDLLEFDLEDIEYPQDLAKKSSEKTLPLQSQRDRITTSHWKRMQCFRKKVLFRYGYQCAVCRCREERLLQAAHIVAVSDGGPDDEENGICLCANHHIMFDNGLINIDHARKTLISVAASVRDMAWYSIFVERYQSKLVLPVNE